MNGVTNFIFDDYSFDVQSKTLSLSYKLDDKHSFTEKYFFDFDFVEYDEAALNSAIESLFFIAGVSYYKAFVPKNIIVSKGTITQPQADFYSKTYQKGLGEFWYVNQLDPNTLVSFPSNSDDLSANISSKGEGLLIGLGGGKDSLVVIEALRNNGQKLTTWSLNHKTQLEPLVNKVGLNHLYVERSIDPKLIELNANGALNGHIPISAIFAACGVVVAILSGNRDVIVGNESSANEDSLVYQGVSVNHQYSKSQEFETDFQKHLSELLSDTMRYYSFLRPLSELRIAEIFALIGFDKYYGLFSSCNRAYTMASDSLFWCGECAKCCFIFLALTPFVDRQRLEALWGGKNLLLEPSLEITYKNLLGISGDKPLDCVGEIKESRSAMRLAEEIYPELKTKYVFDIPDGYDYRQLSSHQMPADIALLFTSFIGQF
ncbi:MAG TPA: hypothetical protein VIH90_03820 [Candidatus Saccharimonadales bacterium]